jgi:hypothetical protein
VFHDCTSRPVEAIFIFFGLVILLEVVGAFDIVIVFLRFKQ